MSTMTRVWVSSSLQLVGVGCSLTLPLFALVHANEITAGLSLDPSLQLADLLRELAPGFRVPSVARSAVCSSAEISYLEYLTKNPTTRGKNFKQSGFKNPGAVPAVDGGVLS